jgi:MFS family permease
MRDWSPPRKAFETSESAITSLIQDQLLQERALKDSLESRAGAVIASAGTLVTLLFALVALVTKSQQYALPLASRFLIGVALVAFLTAAVLAILVIRPREYAVVDEQSLHALANNGAYSAPASIGGPKIAVAIIGLIEKSRYGNTKKAHFLIASVIAEVVAVVVLGLAVGVMLIVS